LSGFKVNFWNYKNEYEIDFVIEKDSNIYGIEIKLKLFNTKITTSIKKFIEKYNPKTIYILNENIDETTNYKKTKIIFTNFININYILNQL
jgi:predicted AAA+ superfamily ATPase